MTIHSLTGLARRVAVGLGVLMFSATASSAALIVIQNGNGAGVGFNDPTPAVPVGGNTGTTLGAQRLNAFQAAANKWGATIRSDVTITVLATMEPLSCTATSALLGFAGPETVWRDFAGASEPGTWYAGALANATAGIDLDSGSWPEIRASFNSNLGDANCLAGRPFYLGFDNNHGTDIDMVTVLEHEFAHGLGFQTFTNVSTGAEFDDGAGAKPSIYDHFLFDTSTNRYWTEMTDAERASSALNSGKLVWAGANVMAAVPQVLDPGMPALTVSSPGSVAGSYLVGTASFGQALDSPGVTGEVMPVVDTAPNVGLACNPLSAVNVAAVNGKIAVVDRGTCTFVVKVKNAQNAGAKGVIVVDNVAGSPPSGLGGTDLTITIPSVRISLADGTTLKTALAKRSRARSGMFANLGVNQAAWAGSDPDGLALMFAPNPFQSQSSVVHWDTSAFPNQLMEPAINADLTHEVDPPEDLTLPLLMDIGWTQ